MLVIINRLNVQGSLINCVTDADGCEMDGPQPEETKAFCSCLLKVDDVVARMKAASQQEQEQARRSEAALTAKQEAERSIAR